MTERRFPVHPFDGGGTISWEHGLKACNAYYEKYGKNSNYPPERMAERGGLDRSELDEYCPEWRTSFQQKRA
jgi:hypothetical protein